MSKIKILVFLFIVSPIAIIFQNCGIDFKSADSGSGSLSVLSQHPVSKLSLELHNALSLAMTPLNGVMPSGDSVFSSYEQLIKSKCEGVYSVNTIGDVTTSSYILSSKSGQTCPMSFNHKIIETENTTLSTSHTTVSRQLRVTDTNFINYLKIISFNCVGSGDYKGLLSIQSGVPYNTLQNTCEINSPETGISLLKQSSESSATALADTTVDIWDFKGVNESYIFKTQSILNLANSQDSEIKTYNGDSIANNMSLEFLYISAYQAVVALTAAL